MRTARKPRYQLQANPTARLTGSAVVPGDKSMSHRALILAALAQGQSTIHGLLESEDVLRTLHAVQVLGASVERQASDDWMIQGSAWSTPEQVIDCGNSGTCARLLMGAVAGLPVVATFSGDESLRCRPMSRVVDPLIAMGAEIDRRAFLPITVRGGGLEGIRYRSPIASAQVKSAILLAGLQTHAPVEVLEPVVSRDHTERMIQHFGCDVDIIDQRGGRLVRLGRRRKLQGRLIGIPGDPSSAAFAIVAALITRNSEVTLRGLLDSPTRNGLLTTLLEMGANIDTANRRTVGGVDVVDVTARSSALKAVQVPASRAPTMIDEYPLLAIAAALASGETVMAGLSELRVKESDRLQAIGTGLRLCGVDAQSQGDTLRVTGSSTPPKGGAGIATGGDHRIAMAFLVLGLASKRPILVDGADMIATSFPGFAEFMAGLGAEIQQC